MVDRTGKTDSRMVGGETCYDDGFSAMTGCLRDGGSLVKISRRGSVTRSARSMLMASSQEVDLTSRAFRTNPYPFYTR